MGSSVANLGTLRQQLEVVWKNTGIKPKELDDLVELPTFFYEVWETFCKLSRRRPSGFGASPISYSEMLAYYTLNQIEPYPWEIRVLELLDNEYMEYYREQQDKETKKK